MTTQLVSSFNFSLSRVRMCVRQILLTAFSLGIHFDDYTILSRYFQDDDFACVHLGDRTTL